MARTIDRERVRALVGEGALLVDVLPSSVWEKLHLEGARNAPLAKIDERWAERADPGRPIVLYCAHHR